MLDKEDEITNLEDKENLRNILVGNYWDPMLNAATFKIFTEYEDVFVWSYKDLKGLQKSWAYTVYPSAWSRTCAKEIV